MSACGGRGQGNAESKDGEGGGGREDVGSGSGGGASSGLFERYGNCSIQDILGAPVHTESLLECDLNLSIGREEVGGGGGWIGGREERRKTWKREKERERMKMDGRARGGR